MKKGYSEDESKLKTQEVMSEIHEKTFKKFKDNPEKYKSKNTTNIEYYVKKGHTEEESKKLLSKRQSTFSKDICIEKYGEEDGLVVWLDRQTKWQKTLSKNGNIKGGYSKISQKLFFSIISNYKKKELDYVFFWTKNSEYFLRSDKSIYLYDYVDLKRKKIIEYNGDQYHANPSIYKSDDTPHPYNKGKGFTSKDIWAKDENKRLLAIENGFDLITIWESEYKKNPQQTLEKCIRFIND
jgi:very-short-patch-repair endonuclease